MMDFLASQLSDPLVPFYLGGLGLAVIALVFFRHLDRRARDSAKTPAE